MYMRCMPICEVLSDGTGIVQLCPLAVIAGDGATTRLVAT